MSLSQAASGKSATKSTIAQRLQVEYLVNPNQSSEIASATGSDVIQGLNQTPKTIPAKYFYDDRGSLLFEQICELPEYYLTRTETAILQQYAYEIANLTGHCELVELGSGSSTKTRILLDAYNQLGYPLCYIPTSITAPHTDAIT
jgi:L-histidine N-alpha-methyltransferase